MIVANRCLYEHAVGNLREAAIVRPNTNHFTSLCKSMARKSENRGKKEEVGVFHLQGPQAEST